MILRNVLLTLIPMIPVTDSIVAAQESAYRCVVRVHSTEGGALEVITGEEWRGINDGPQIAWHPPSSDPAMDLTIGYYGSSLEGLSAPTGAHFRAILANGARPSDVAIVIRDHGRGHWRFSANDAARGSFAWRDDTFEGGFTRSDARGRAILNRLDEYRNLQISILIRNHTAAVAKIDLSNVSARDSLLSEARNAVDNHDPTVCARVS